MIKTYEAAVWAKLQEIEDAIKAAPEGADLTELETRRAVLQEVVNYVQA